MKPLAQCLSTQGVGEMLIPFHSLCKALLSNNNKEKEEGGRECLHIHNCIRVIAKI